MAETRPRRTGRQDFPKRGEIYLTALNPALGHEIKKTRPALVIQNDVTNRLVCTGGIANRLRFDCFKRQSPWVLDSIRGQTLFQERRFYGQVTDHLVDSVARERLITTFGTRALPRRFKLPDEPSFRTYLRKEITSCPRTAK